MGFLDRSWVNQSCICRATNYNHVKLINSYCCMSLTPRSLHIQAVLDLGHLVSLSIKHLHVFQYFIAVIKTTIEIYFIVHAGNRVIYARFRDFVTLTDQWDLENSIQLWVDDFYGARIFRAQILEAIETIV